MSVQAVLAENAGGTLREAFLRCGRVLDEACEIRIRQGLPLIIRTFEKEYIYEIAPTSAQIMAMMEKLCGHSLYAYDAEIRNGFVTIAGGHRVGICGRVTLDGGQIKTIKHISGLSIRVARQVLGAADAVMPHLLGNSVANSIIISPPGCGKTTLLRDAARQFSLRGYNVAVVDERSEIAGCHLGVAQMDLGPRTDVLDAVPKAAGMMMVLRALSPQVVVVDEIGGGDDVTAIENMVRSGVAVICTLHGRDVADIKGRAFLAPLLWDGVFTRFVFMTDKPRPGKIAAVYDENFDRVGE